MYDVKYFICPMSKNIVDAVLELNRSDIGLLPSRRQIDYTGGYVGWNTEDFIRYVDGKILVQRDHGGAGQGTYEDDGRHSYITDAKSMNLIHIDPWKVSSTKEIGLQKTLEDILFINSINPMCKFEVGTEHAIFPMSSEDLWWFVTELKDNLDSDVFNNIEYVVIQSGVNLDVVNEINTGIFSLQKLKDEIDICNTFNKKSKEHNGDFLTKQQRHLRFETGLTSINIGPELSIFENSMYINNFSHEELRDADNICYESGLWKKWMSTNKTQPEEGLYFRICGHYNYSKINLPDVKIVDMLKEKILNIVEEHE